MVEHKLTKYEMETIVNFNDEETMCSVYTHNKSLQKKLDKFCISHPDTYVLVEEQKNWGSKTYEFPKRLISFRTPKEKKVLSDEEKRIISERLKNGKGIKNSELK